jgi:hypothetical protein
MSTWTYTDCARNASVYFPQEIQLLFKHEVFMQNMQVRLHLQIQKKLEN